MAKAKKQVKTVRYQGRNISLSENDQIKKNKKLIYDNPKLLQDDYDRRKYFTLSTNEQTKFLQNKMKKLGVQPQLSNKQVVLNNFSKQEKEAEVDRNKVKKLARGNDFGLLNSNTTKIKKVETTNNKIDWVKIHNQVLADYNKRNNKVNNQESFVNDAKKILNIKVENKPKVQKPKQVDEQKTFVNNAKKQLKIAKQNNTPKKGDLDYKSLDKMEKTYNKNPSKTNVNEIYIKPGTSRSNLIYARKLPGNKVLAAYSKTGKEIRYYEGDNVKGSYNKFFNLSKQKNTKNISIKDKTAFFKSQSKNNSIGHWNNIGRGLNSQEKLKEISFDKVVKNNYLGKDFTKHFKTSTNTNKPSTPKQIPTISFTGNSSSNTQFQTNKIPTYNQAIKDIQSKYKVGKGFVKYIERNYYHSEAFGLNKFKDTKQTIEKKRSNIIKEYKQYRKNKFGKAATRIGFSVTNSLNQGWNSGRRG